MIKKQDFQFFINGKSKPLSQQIQLKMNIMGEDYICDWPFQMAKGTYHWNGGVASMEQMEQLASCSTWTSNLHVL